MHASLFLPNKAFGMHIIINCYNINLGRDNMPVLLTFIFFALGVDRQKKLRIIRLHQLTIVN